MKKFLFYPVIILFCIKVSAQVSLVQFQTNVIGLTDLASCGDERIFAGVKSGKIFAFDSSGNAKPGPFLSITSKVNSAGLEKGLLGFTFDKNYSSTGIFYVYYVALPGFDSR